MALTRIQSVFTYSSASGGQTYLFDVVVDAQGFVSVRNIRSPLGLITDTFTGVPQAVLDDMNEAKEAVVQISAETQVASGNLVFDGTTSEVATIPGGVLNNTSYRVVYTPPDAILVRTSGKSITGFTASVATAYGTQGSPKTVGYVVLVASQQASVNSGVLTFQNSDGGIKSVTFGVAFSTTAYRVVLSPDDFFSAKVVNKTKTGFSVELATSIPDDGTQLTVGYDVFVG